MFYSKFYFKLWREQSSLLAKVLEENEDNYTILELYGNEVFTILIIRCKEWTDPSLIISPKDPVFYALMRLEIQGDLPTYHQGRLRQTDINNWCNQDYFYCFKEIAWK